MDFFKLINENMKDGQKINMTILKRGDKLVASIIADTTGVKDAAVKEIPPLVVNGMPDEFEESFAEVFKPIAQSLSLVSDVQNYEAGVEEARKKTEMEKKEKEHAALVKKKFDEAINSAKKLKDEKKYRDAKEMLAVAGKLEGADNRQIEKLLAEIRNESGEGSLFGGGEDLSDGSYAEKMNFCDNDNDNYNENEEDE